MAKLYWTGAFGYLDKETGDGILSSRIKKDIDASAGGPLEVDLMSPGGDFWQIAPIMGMIRGHRGQTILNMVGLVGSAASAVAMAFTERVSYDLSVFFIHNAQGMAGGDHNAMGERAKELKELSEMMAAEYVRATGLPMAKIKELMDGESGNGTWITGKKIHELGFSTRHVSESDSRPINETMMLFSAKANFRDMVSMLAKSTPETQSFDMATAKAIESLIDSGAIDKLSAMPTVKDSDVTLSIEKNPVAINGKVYRSSLRSISARAAKDEPELAKWATAMIAKIDAKGDLKVNKEAVLAWLKDNPGCASEVASTMGLNLVTEAVTKAVEMKAKLEAANVADPLALIATMKADLEKVEAARIEAAMSVFGPKVSPSGAKNKSREFAELALRGVKSDEIEAKIEEVKKNEVFLALRGELFDVNSDWNMIGVSEMGGDRAPKGDKFERHLKL
jgi:ATP-dependent protease ClpP protease subunit